MTIYIRFLIEIPFVCSNFMHIVHFRFRINKMYFENHRLEFGESVMIVFEELHGYTRARRMLDLFSLGRLFFHFRQRDDTHVHE